MVEDFTKKKERSDGASSTTASTDYSGGVDRRHTLVIGGFARDTRRQVLLGKVKDMITSLGLEQDMDKEPFCTGPRRSFCLAQFVPRSGERLDQVRERLHKVMGIIVRARVPVEGMERPIWAGPSKSREAREKASHCSRIRAAVKYFNPDLLAELDLDHNTGTSWIRSSKVACSSSKCDASSRRIFNFEEKADKPWVDLGALSKEIQADEDELEAFFKDQSSR